MQFIGWSIITLVCMVSRIAVYLIHPDKREAIQMVVITYSITALAIGLIFLAVYLIKG